LRLTNAEHERLASMAEGWRRISPDLSEQAQRVLLYRLGPLHLTDHALLAWARSDATAHDPAWHDLAGLPQRWTAPAFPLKAADLMERGVEKGPALGTAMRAAEEAWIAAGFPEDAAALAAIAAAEIKRA
jgi:poly(A) polymerase